MSCQITAYSKSLSLWDVVYLNQTLIRNMCTMVYTYLSRSSLSSSLFIKPGLSKSRKLLFLMVLSRKWLSSFICNHKHADKLICLTFTIRNLNIYHGFKYRPIWYNTISGFEGPIRYQSYNIGRYQGKHWPILTADIENIDIKNYWPISIPISRF